MWLLTEKCWPPLIKRNMKKDVKFHLPENGEKTDSLNAVYILPRRESNQNEIPIKPVHRPLPVNALSSTRFNSRRCLRNPFNKNYIWLNRFTKPSIAMFPDVIFLWVPNSFRPIETRCTPTARQKKREQKYKGQRTRVLWSIGKCTVMWIKGVNRGFARLIMMLLFILRFVRLLRLIFRRLDGLLSYSKSYSNI